jgi:hypothetical protein
LFFKKIVNVRNKRAHEAIDDINLLVENFNEVFNYLGETLTSADFEPKLLDLNEIKEINQHIKMIEEFADEEEKEE